MKKKILAFLIPSFLFVMMFIFNDIILGDYSFFYSDLQFQYNQLVIYFKDILTGIHSMFYSFEIGFGTPFISTLAYYLICPFNLLVIFFEKANIELFFILITIIKIGLCGLTMYYYLSYNNKSTYLLIFSTSYALSYYIIINYFQYMWLDAYLLAPLLLLGIDKIINEKNYLLYGITLFLILLTNYYMGYMCCLFAVVYFIYKYLLSKKDKSTIKIFFIISILFGLMTMFIHVPNLLNIFEVNRENSKLYIFNKDIINIFSRMFLGSHDGNILNEFTPFLYIGIFNLILLFLYFFNPTFSKRERVLSFCLNFILLLSILIVPLNNFWHALSNPIGFNFRYIYLFNVFNINLCLKSFINIKHVKKIYYYVLMVIILILLNIFIVNENIKLLFIYINLILLYIYIFIFRCEDKEIYVLFIILAISELFFNGYINIRSNSYSYRKFIDGRYSEKTGSVNFIPDNYFYRMEFEERTGLNDPLNYGYFGLTGWLSSNKFNSNFYNFIGYYSYNNIMLYNHYLLLDSLFGIKYYESSNKIDYYNIINTHQISSLDEMLYGMSFKESFLYENPYALSLGYMVDEHIKDSFTCSNAFECQNIIIKNISGDDLYKIEEITDNIKIEENKDFYLLIVENSIDINNSYDICLNDSCYNLNFKSNKSIYVKNNFEIGDEISIEIDGKNDISNIYLAYFDFNRFEQIINKLKNNQLNITSFKENHIKGNINVDDNNVLFLSIPYDDGFKILVDNKEVNYYKVIDNFIGLDLEKGYHDIEIIYEVKGFKLGLFVSLLSLITYILIRKHL